MNADQNDKINVPRWAWIIMTTAFLLVISAIWWASSASVPRTARVDVSRKPVTDNGYIPPQSYSVVGEPSPQAFAQDSRSMPPASVNISSSSPGLPAGPVKPRFKQRLAPKLVVRKPANIVHDMFPMGNVVDNIPQQRHMFRTPAELFPAFSYAGKLWSFGGTFAFSGQLDLVTVGYKVGDKDIYALANTTGPGRALFVQSDQDPDKFAIYR